MKTSQSRSQTRKPFSKPRWPYPTVGWVSILAACTITLRTEIAKSGGNTPDSRQPATSASTVASRVTAPAGVPSTSASSVKSTAKRIPGAIGAAGSAPSTSSPGTSRCWVREGGAETNQACRLIRQLNLKELASYPSFDCEGGSFDPERESSLCFPGADGVAWGILFRKARTAQGEGTCPAIRATYSVAFVTKYGKIYRSSGRDYFADGFRRPLLYAQDRDSDSPLMGAVFDYDRDGIPELVLPMGQENHNGRADWRGDVWTVKQGRVLRYARAPRNVVGTLDADCDGRPDLLTDAPFRAALERSGPYYSGWAGAQETPVMYLLAHSRTNGGFSLTDPASLNFAAQQCTEASTGFEHQVSDNAWADFWTVRCAKLWGVATARLTKDINRDCRRSNCYVDEPDCCKYKSLLLKWARTRAPLTLKPSPTPAE